MIAEIAWVLSSYYNEPVSEAVQKLRLILCFKGLEIPDKDNLLLACQIWEAKKVDFIDAYIAAWLADNRIKQIYSFDKDFDRIEEIERLKV